MHYDGSEEGEPRRFSQITIRGVDRVLYNRLSKIARRMGINVGTLINKSMELFLSALPHDGGPRIIRYPLDVSSEFMRGFLEGLGNVIEEVEELSVSRKDLLDSERALVFVGIGKLRFEEDVDEETFRSKVRAIYHCKEIIIPETLPKMLVLSVSRKVGKVTVVGRDEVE